jgi:hypothetical protein
MLFLFCLDLIYVKKFKKKMNVHQKKRKIFGKEFVFTVQDEELKTPIYRQIRGVIKEPSL